MHQENVFFDLQKTADLSAADIAIILKGWNISGWEKMTADDFRETFQQSEFHLLRDENETLLAVARINFDFQLKINGNTNHFPELVGLVAIQKNKGFGRMLMGFIKTNLTQRDIETIGFCEAPLRPFYEKCAVEVLYGKAKFLREPEGDGWTIPTDDDVLNISLKPDSVGLFNKLNEENVGYLIF